MNSGKKTTFLCIMFFIIGGCVTLFAYMEISSLINHNTHSGSYFAEYLETRNTIDLNDFEVGILTGDSMYPTIPDNSIIISIKDKIEVGDIITFENYDEKLFGNAESISHRVIDIKTKNNKIYYKTKGDNVKYSEGWVSEDKVIEKIVGVLY